MLIPRFLVKAFQDDIFAKSAPHCRFDDLLHVWEFVPVPGAEVQTVHAPQRLPGLQGHMCTMDKSLFT